MAHLSSNGLNAQMRHSGGKFLQNVCWDYFSGGIKLSKNKNLRKNNGTLQA